MVAPSLSELQAKLRTGADATGATQAKGMPPGLPKQGQKRPPFNSEDGTNGPPKKRPLLQQNKVAIVKTPAKPKSAQSPVPGLSAKVPTPGSATPPAPLEEGGTSAKSAALPAVAFQKAPVPQGPPAKRGADSRPNTPAAQNLASSIAEVVHSIEAAAPAAKQRHATQLAEVLGQTLAIEHINTFLRTLRAKIVERAQSDGVQAIPSPAPKANSPAPKAPTPSAPKAAPTPSAGENAGGATATTAKSGGIAKVPPKAKADVPLSKITMAKAALSKSAGMMAAQAAAGEVPKAPAKAKAAKAAIAKVPPKQIQQQPAKASVGSAAVASTSKASPPASPSGENVPDDALYQLVGELTEDPVVQDGLILEDRLNEVFRRLWEGAARKPKDWVAAWQALGIPGDRQGEALQKLLNIAFVQTEDPDKAPLILAELVKGHKVKMRAVEDVFVSFGQNLDGILAINEEAWQVYAKFLFHVFPKPQTAGWGWSRVGWDFRGWWQFCERCVQSLEPSRSFDVIGLVLRLCQDKEGVPIHSCQVWLDGDRLAKILAKLCDLGGCELPEVGERLALLGVHAMEGSF